MDGIILRLKENGEAELYQEPYTTIECETEEDYNRLEYLVRLGAATEKAFAENSCTLFIDSMPKVDVCYEFEFTNTNQLIDWAEKED